MEPTFFGKKNLIIPAESSEPNTKSAGSPPETELLRVEIASSSAEKSIAVSGGLPSFSALIDSLNSSALILFRQLGKEPSHPPPGVFPLVHQDSLTRQSYQQPFFPSASTT